MTIVVDGYRRWHWRRTDGTVAPRQRVGFVLGWCCHRQRKEQEMKEAAERQSNVLANVLGKIHDEPIGPAAVSMSLYV